MSTVLEGILAQTRATLEQRRAAQPLGNVAPRAGARTFAAALAQPTIAVIAEFKRRSPSAGALAEQPVLEDVVAAYTKGGAAALSILTEEANFAGTLGDLRAARALTALPLLRKDFVVERYQLEEAVLAGADAVLLIVAALDDGTLGGLLGAAEELNLDVIVEVHDADELARAAAVGAPIIGVNNRDLRDFSVDVRRTEELLSGVPPATLVVSESGIGDAAQVKRLQAAGVDAVLVGEALMRSGNAQRTLSELLRGI